MKRIKNLKTALNFSKKRFYRYIYITLYITDHKIQTLEETINKMTARDEMLELFKSFL